MSARLREHATYDDLMKVPETMVAELTQATLVPEALATSAAGRAG